MVTQEKIIEACAQAAHEVNKAYCEAIGDTSQPIWATAPDWQKTSARKGVEGALAGNTPEQSHEGWLAEKKATGWKYGPVKDPEKKEHPCFVPYAELPPEQRAKDLLFTTTVRVVAKALGAQVKGGDSELPKTEHKDDEIQTLRAQTAALEERVRVAEQRANDAEKRERIVRASLASPLARPQDRGPRT
jgi:hypothetical protein